MVAYICPLYDMKNHFALGLELARSKLKHKVTGDFYFVFSNKEQQEKFFSLLDDDKNAFKYLIIPSKYDVYKAKVITKKFYALRKLMYAYDYLIIVDSESRFIKMFDSDNLCNEIWNNHNTLVANKSYDGYFIQRVCYKNMGLMNNKKLLEETENFLYNYWFNEIQVYKCSVLQKFFLWLKNFDIEKILNEWSCFEYYVFAAYLILEEDWHIKKISRRSFGGINEYLFVFDKTKQIQILNDLKTHWSSNADVTNDNTCMVFHLDRANNLNDYADFSLKNKIRCIIRRRLCIIKDQLFC